MMRKYFAAALAVSLMCAAGVVPSLGAAAKDDPALVLKKKTLQAEIKALEAKKVALASRVSKIKPKAVKSVNVITKPVAAPAMVQTTSVQPCKSFLQCLFGRKQRRVAVQNAAMTGSADMVLSNNTTNEVVAWNETKYPVGSLVVRTPERALYYVSNKGEAIRYSIGVGREGMQWSGTSSIVRKAEWPSWTPPKVMIEREAAKGHIIPPFMEGGPGNPLGARAMYIGGRMYRVHGTNNEASIGGAVSSGCIRMMNADVIDLYDRVKVGAKIYVYQ